MSEAPRWFLVVAALLLAAHAAMWLLLPSQNVHHDGLDELLRLEAGHLELRARHPLSEPALALWVGERRPALRPVQVWSGGWMTVALAGVFALGLRTRARPIAVLGATVLAASSYAALHVATDPFQPYQPAGLALGTWGLALSAPDPRRPRSAVALLSAAALFFPVALAFAGAAALRLLADGQRRAAAFHLLAPAGLLGLAMVLAPVGLTDGGVGLRLGVLHTIREGLLGALIPVDRGFAPLRLLENPTSPAAWLTALSLLAAAVWTGAVLVRARRPDLPLLVVAGACAVFAALWDPGAPLLWLPAVWLLALAGLSRPRVASVALAAGAGLLAVNLVCYVVPAARMEDPRVTSARALAAELGPEDFVLTAGFPDLHIAYFGGLRVDGPAEEWRRFGQAFEETRTAGGAVWVEGGEALLPTERRGRAMRVGERVFCRLLEEE